MDSGISVVHFSQITEQDLQPLIRQLASISSRVTVQSARTSSYVAWEYLWPPVVAVYIARRSIRRFLRGLGAATADSLKWAFVGAIQRARRPTLVGSGIRSRGHPTRPRKRPLAQVRLTSLEFAIAPGLTTRRFVFPGDLAETDVEEALDRLASALSVAAESRRLSLTVLASHIFT